MASLDQDVVVFDHDQLQLKFNVIDAADSLYSLSARGWWGIATSPSSSVIFEKTNGAWSATGTVPPTGNTGQLSVASYYLNVYIKHADMLNLTPGSEYYHELVYTAQNDTNQTLVLSNGKYFVSKSIMTELGMR